MWIFIVLVVLAVSLAIVFSLGLHRKPQYIQNYEEAEFGSEHAFVDPVSVVDGLAIYAMGHGEPVLLLPYPHGHTTEPMAQGPMAEILAGQGRTVVSFDVPGAYRSTREPVGDMDEMIRLAKRGIRQMLAGQAKVLAQRMPSRRRVSARPTNASKHFGEPLPSSPSVSV